MQILSNAVQLSHLLIGAAVPAAKTIVDATAGNGGDTLFMAQRAAAGCCIYAFDVQQAALDTAKARLDAARQVDAGIAAVKFICDSHEQVDKYVHGRIDLAVFNLGYLPGGDHALTTRCAGTLAALQKMLKMLSTGGHISIAVYPGHPEGKREAEAVKEWARQLPKKFFTAGWYEMVNHGTNAPALCWIEKVGEQIEVS